MGAAAMKARMVATSLVNLAKWAFAACSAFSLPALRCRCLCSGHWLMPCALDEHAAHTPKKGALSCVHILLDASGSDVAGHLVKQSYVHTQMIIVGALEGSQCEGRQ